MEHLKINEIEKFFGRTHVLKKFSFSIEQGEFVCLLGPSGCGKTTLLRIIAGLEQPNNGSVYLNLKDITNHPPARRNFGIVFQSYALFPNLTAEENVAYGLQTKKITRKEKHEKVHQTLELVNLGHIAKQYPSQLSGGQQQRIALARAIAMSPDFLLLDEPLSALDAKVRVQLRNEIKQLQKRLGITTIMVTHDQEEALSMADRIVVMNNGALEQSGLPQDIYDHPETPFVADFIGTMNFVGKTFGASQNRHASIRPEHVKLLFTSSPSAFPVSVEHVEFRGGSYRVLLKQTKESGSLWADVTAEAFKAHPLDIGEVLYAELPKSKLIYFEAVPGSQPPVHS
ncbi:ATP-binding cassette domain-containing protein [Halobacillus salinarum]|uniref:ATP-binding cassette domain-containing protein n=1 Tax=Halobacillus salinarum TaxID=2932257 RepID=A0ABY4EI55_9BACI|nr:ATP-binding cassette domain-containing protein [Halobacillus salinarum]UOQ43304.1 ATP-binding cassette domain-containing protein [Halobacillus salinarum]